MSPILLAMLAAGVVDQETANRIDRTTDPEALRIWAEAELQTAFGGALNAQQGRLLDFVQANANPTPAQWDRFWEAESPAMWAATGDTLVSVASETAMLQATTLNLADTFSFINQQTTDWTTNYYTALDGVTPGSLGQLNQTSRTQFADAFTSWRTGALGDTAGRADGFPQLIRATANVFGPERAERIAVTESTRIRAESQRQIEAGEESTTYWRFLSSADEKTCEICGPLHGQIQPKSSRTWDHPILGQLNGPPMHVRCILPGNVVIVPGRIEAATKSFYIGPVIEIRTAAGRKVSVTENHPILTGSGWRPAKSIRKGDNLLGSSDAYGIAFRVNPNDYNVPTVIEKVFESFSMSGGVTTVSVPVAPEDFHGDGDGIQGNIEIVHIDGFLVGDGVAQGFEKGSELSLAGVDGASGLDTHGTVTHFGVADSAPPHGIVGGLDLGGSLAGTHAGPLDGLGLRLVTEFNPGLGNGLGYNSPAKSGRFEKGVDAFAVGVPVKNFGQHRGNLSEGSTSSQVRSIILEKTGNGLLIDSQFPGEFIDRFAGLIAEDEVVGVRKYSFTGHVYDLQVSDYGLFFTDSIITHNCRCAITPETNLTRNIAPLSDDFTYTGPDAKPPTGGGGAAAQQGAGAAEAQPERRRNLSPDVEGLDPSKVNDWYTRGEANPPSGFDYDTIKEQKSKIASDLSKATGAHQPETSAFVQQWAETSNDTDLRSLEVQRVAADEFGTKLSQWQQEKLDRMMNSRREIEAMSERQRRNLGLTSRSRNTMLPYEQRGFEDFRTVQESEQLTRKSIRAMYETTQSELSSAGVNEVVLYRGVKLGEKLTAGSSVQINSNALESWSISRDIAERFAGESGNVIAARVPAARIFSTSRTGFGCLDEYEFVVMSSPVDDIVKVIR